jgi:transcription initiation factor IIE alpha subunit
VTTDETKEQLANIVGEMRDSIREKLESMEAEGIACIPISDVRIILNEHYNLMYQIIYDDR